MPISTYQPDPDQTSLRKPLLYLSKNMVSLLFAGQVDKTVTIPNRNGGIIFQPFKECRYLHIDDNGESMAWENLLIDDERRMEKNVTADVAQTLRNGLLLNLKEHTSFSLSDTETATYVMSHILNEMQEKQIDIHHKGIEGYCLFNLYTDFFCHPDNHHINAMVYAKLSLAEENINEEQEKLALKENMNNIEKITTSSQFHELVDAYKTKFQPSPSDVTPSVSRRFP